MLIQGDLQAVFDALYTIGAIEPMLKTDWDKIFDEMESHPHRVQLVFHQINQCRGDKNLILNLLSKMDFKDVQVIAMEVAREFAEFSNRQILH